MDKEKTATAPADDVFAALNRACVILGLPPNPLFNRPAGKEAVAVTSPATKQKRIDERLEFQQGYRLDDASALAVCWSIRACKTLHTLRFWSNGLSAPAISQLASALPQTQITTLYLDYNPVSGTGAPRLITAMDPMSPRKPRPMTSDVSSSEVFAELLGSQSPLQFLSLRGCRITDTVCSALLRKLTPTPPPPTATTPSNTATTSKPSTISSNSANVTASTPASSGPLTALVALDLGHNQLSDRSAEMFGDFMLRDCCSLEYLSLRANFLTDRGFQHLSVSLQPVLLDQLDAVKLKRDGYRIRPISNTGLQSPSASAKHLREANRTLNWLSLADNRLTQSCRSVLLNTFAESFDGLMDDEQIQRVQAAKLEAEEAATAAANASLSEATTSPPPPSSQASLITAADQNKWQQSLRSVASPRAASSSSRRELNVAATPTHTQIYPPGSWHCVETLNLSGNAVETGTIQLARYLSSKHCTMTTNIIFD